MIPDPLSLLTFVLLITISFFTSAASAAMGVGGGVALIVIMLMLLPPAIVLPVHGVVQTGSNLGRALLMRASVDWRLIMLFAGGSLVGVTIGSQVFVALPTRMLSLALALFILWSLWAPKLRASSIPRKGFVGVGALASFLTMFVGATGPVVAVFLNVEQLGRKAVVASQAAMMVIQHVLKVIAFGFLGFAFGEWLPLMVLMIISGFLGTMAGKRILERLPEQRFALLFKAVLTVLALRLLWSALR